MNILKYGRNFIILLSVLSSAALFFTSCSALDVVGRDGLKSFDRVYEKTGMMDNNGNAVLASPEKSEIFIISGDFSLTREDLALEINITDFYRAGFDPYRVDEKSFLSGEYSFNPTSGMIRLSYDISDRENTGKESPAAFLVSNYPERLGYHKQFDHYGFEPGGGVMVEWAADLKENDKDLVFVLDPAPFVSAGLDPLKLKDWVYGSVKVMDKKTGKPLEVMKLLRIYNIE